MRHILSTRLAFFVAGVATSALAPLIPYARARIGVDEAGLGVLLLCLGAGSILAMPLAGMLAARLGCRSLIMASSLLICVTLPLLAMLSEPLQLGLALFAFGAAIGSLDCVMNIQALVVERAAQRRLMSGFHGLYSVGGIAGAAALTAMLTLGMTPFAATLAAVVLIAGIMAFARPHLLDTATEGGTVFALPHGVVLLIGLLAFVLFLTEGAVLDWSAVVLTSLHAVDPAWAGMGYAVFAAAMTLGRLTGDTVVHRIGGRRVLLFGPILAASGLAVAAILPTWEAALLGYALVGLGCSNVVPVLFSAIGRQNVMPESIAVPAVSALGYAGILAGPALIGFVAHLVGLSLALLALAGLLMMVSANARAVPVR